MKGLLTADDNPGPCLWTQTSGCTLAQVWHSQPDKTLEMPERFMQTFQQIKPDFRPCVGCLKTSRGEPPVTFCPVLHNPLPSTFLDDGAANLYLFQSMSRVYGPLLFKIQQLSVYCQDLHASTALVSWFLSARSFSQGSKIQGILVVAALVLSLVASILC